MDSQIGTGVLNSLPTFVGVGHCELYRHPHDLSALQTLWPLVARKLFQPSVAQGQGPGLIRELACYRYDTLYYRDTANCYNAL